MLSNVDVAYTVMVVSLRSSARVTTPVCDTVALSSSASATLHTTDCGAKLAVATVTESASVPSESVAVEGDTVTDETAGVAGISIAPFAKGDTLKVFHT